MEEKITVQRRIEQIENLEKENKEARSMLKESLENDPIYLETLEEVRSAVAKRQKLKNEILGKLENQKIQANIKENIDELGTLKEILTSELVKFYEEKHINKIEDQYGEPREFKIVIKLMPRKKRYDERDGEGRFAKNEGEMIPQGTVFRELPEINVGTNQESA